jgi:hypothetical protein
VDHALDEAIAASPSSLVVEHHPGSHPAEPAKGSIVRDHVVSLSGDDHDGSDELVGQHGRPGSSQGERSPPRLVAAEEPSELLFASPLASSVRLSHW